VSLPAAARRVRRRGTALGLLAWLTGVAFFLPAAWMVLTSLHSESDAAANPPSLAA
jgi:sorbitol/mannitol transport system permease protein